ncbi:MAG: 5'-nucleotidase C-terminal domain-containing protein, partial [Pseudobdellovibrionaceae bacterium]
EKIIGTTKEPLYRYAVNQTNLDMILADAIRTATKTDIGLSNGFRFASPIVPGSIQEKDLWTIYPINNPLRVGKVTGAQLKSFWEQEIENVYSSDARKLFGGWLPRPSGMTLKFKVGAPFGQRVQEIRVGGKLLELNKIYTIAACAREGDPQNKVCRIPNISEPKDLSVDAHEAVRMYLKTHKGIKAPTDQRVIAEDLPNTVRSQFYRK